MLGMFAYFFFFFLKVREQEIEIELLFSSTADILVPMWHSVSYFCNNSPRQHNNIIKDHEKNKITQKQEYNIKKWV